jgi:hypothetical protein
MELMKVIEFPKQKIEEKDNRDRKEKLEQAYKMLDYLIDAGADFNIIVDIEKANELFEISESQMKKFQYIAISTNYDKFKKIRFAEGVNKVACYQIKGDEF